MASHPIFQFYAELDDYKKPKIWRRFQVANDITVARFGYILMTLFEMQASHLFCFDVPTYENFRARTLKTISPEEFDRLFSNMRLYNRVHLQILHEDFPYDPEEGETVCDAKTHKLKYAVSQPGERLMFWYDFGDDWLVSLVLEKVIRDSNISSRDLPHVLEGEGFGIVEDCGGIGGLAELAKAFKKKKGRAYDEFRQWLGVDDLDLNAFDLDDMNFRLKKIPRIYMQVYEQDLTPTQRSINLIERRYRKR